MSPSKNLRCQNSEDSTSKPSGGTILLLCGSLTRMSSLGITYMNIFIEPYISILKQPFVSSFSQQDSVLFWENFLNWHRMIDVLEIYFGQRNIRNLETIVIVYFYVQ